FALAWTFLEASSRRSDPANPNIVQTLSVSVLIEACRFPPQTRRDHRGPVGRCSGRPAALVDRSLRSAAMDQAGSREEECPQDTEQLRFRDGRLPAALDSALPSQLVLHVGLEPPPKNS